MPRKATGTVYKYGDHWVMRITLADGSRGRPQHFSPDVTEAQARAAAAKVSARERETATKKKEARARTADAWAERWFAEREKRGQTGVRQDRGRWRKWISPHLLSMADATADDCEAIVRVLDDAMRADVIRPKTAKLIWGVVTAAFDEACESKVPALRVRVRENNPTERVRGPDAGAERVAAWLYPSEMATLLACQRVPIRWRRLIAVQGYTYLRPGELEALRCDAVDLAADVFVIHQAADYSKKKGATKGTKTAHVGVPVRRVPIEPMLRPLVEVLLREAAADGRDLLVTMPPVSDLAASFRMYLRRAGLTRPELYADDSARRPIRWRDLRGTGLTWRALRGDRIEHIQDAAGHTSITTTQGYVKAGEVVGLGVGAPFPPLPPELLEPTRIVSVSASIEDHESKTASPAGFEPHQMHPERSDGDGDALVFSPFGVLRYGQAASVAEAVTIPVTIPPASLADQVDDACAKIAATFRAGRGTTARDTWRDLGGLLRFGGERRRGAPRYVTDPRSGQTLTVSAWARVLGRTSQGLTHRLDTMPVTRALTPAKRRAA